MSTQVSRKPGQRSFGPRKAATVRLPEQQFEAYEEQARLLDIPLGSYIALKLAEAHNEPAPDYVVAELDRAARRRQQEEFDLPRAG